MVSKLELDPSLYDAMLKVKEGNTVLETRNIKLFDYDGFFDHIDLKFKYRENPQVMHDTKLTQMDDRWEVRNTVLTPDGDLTDLTVYPKYDPETLVEKQIKNIEEDFKKYRHPLDIDRIKDEIKRLEKR